MLLYYLLQMESQIIFPTFIWHQNQLKNQVLGNHCVYSQIYWMLNLQQPNVDLWLQNQNANPWNCATCFGEKNKKGHSKINEQIKRNLYTWISLHPQVVQSPISNDCLKVMLYDQTEPQLGPNCYLRCLLENYIITLWVTQMMVVSKMLGMKMVKLLSAIQHCVHCCHHN